jgi:hypothetical protein
MKKKLPIFAIMAVSSQLAMAEAANDPDFRDSVSALDSGSSSTEEHVVERELPPLNVEVRVELQSTLEAQMNFESKPSRNTDNEMASTH